MKKILTGGLAAITLGGAVLGGASAAEARPYHHGGGDGAAVAAGIFGLALGAALASSSDHGYYDRGYYARDGYYGPAPAAYYGPTYYSTYRNCRVEWHWDRRWGHYERARVCF